MTTDTPRPERVYRPGDRALVLFGDGVRRPATLSDGFAWVADDNPAKVIFAEGGFDAEPAPRPERVTCDPHHFVWTWPIEGGSGSVGVCDLCGAVTTGERDAAREQVLREEIAQEIEAKYLGPDSGRGYDGRESPDAALRNAYDEGLEMAARIARGETR